MCFASMQAGVQEKNRALIDHASAYLSNSLKKKILMAIREQNLPIRLSYITSAIPDYPVEIIREKLLDNFGAKFEDDIIHFSSLSISVQCVLVLRKIGHALTLGGNPRRVIAGFSKGLHS